MSLEAKSKELKDFVSVYDTQWFLGDLSGLMKNIANDRASDQLGKLSSPLRQLFYLGGLLVSSEPSNGVKIQYSPDEWNTIIVLLNEIELEYDKIFFPKEGEEISEEWKRARQVAMPSFLSYFNQGPLNFEEQGISWVNELYSQLDILIEESIGLETKHFLQFYENLDTLIQKKFQGFGSPKGGFQKEWLDLTKITMGVPDELPDFIKEMGEQNRPLYTFMADHGIINRFKPQDLISENLNEDVVNKILGYLACTRAQTDFIYYTETRPGNPLYEKPIIDIGDDIFQVFEVKQVLHAIEDLLENMCSSTNEGKTKLIDVKGKLLEDRILIIFKELLGSDCKIYTSYYIDGCEQDILILWKGYAFIIEAKGYKLNEPLRDPNRAFKRIKQEFNNSIGYGYKQARRVQQKFVEQVPLKIEDKHGNVIEEIDTTKYEEGDFSIIVNLKSFGQIQNDLSLLLEIDEDCGYPWVVKLDDLEIFILTIIAQNKKPMAFVDYLLIREEMHGKLICSDELQICGAFLKNKINSNAIKNAGIIAMMPDLAEVFDEQYKKGLGFKNEKLLSEKKSGRYIFW